MRREPVVAIAFTLAPLRWTDFVLVLAATFFDDFAGALPDDLVAAAPVFGTDPLAAVSWLLRMEFTSFCRVLSVLLIVSLSPG
jgi:hypothetical protein